MAAVARKPARLAETNRAAMGQSIAFELETD